MKCVIDKSHVTTAFLLAGFLSLSFAIVVTDLQGRVEFATLGNCSRPATPFSHHQSWVFPLVPGQAVHLTIHGLDSRLCKNASLLIHNNITSTNYCDHQSPVSIIAMKFEAFVVTLKLRFGRCGEGPMFDYRYLDLLVRTSPNEVAAVNETISFQLDRFRFDDVKETMTCSILFANTSEINIFNETYELSRSFRFPGLHRFTASCYFPKWNRSVRADDVIKVETLLNLDDLKISFQPRGIPYLSSSSVITFVHRFASPVNYTFALGPYSLSKMKEPISDVTVGEHLHTYVEFVLGNRTQRSIGPGMFPFTLTLTNAISSACYHNNISLNQDFIGAKIATNDYVAIKPNYFFINITLTEGAPAILQLRLRKYTEDVIEEEITTFCSSKCDRIITRAQVGRGLHRIDALLYNDYYGVALSWGPFEALPQVYDVYLTSLSSVQVGQVRTVSVFIRSDLGRFILVLIHNGKRRQIPFDRFSTRFQHNLKISLPFDPSPFGLVQKGLFFAKPGMNRIKVFVKNGMQTFAFEDGRVFVRRARSCLDDVRIAGIPLRMRAHDVLNITENLVLRAEVITRCLERNQVMFEWTFMRGSNKFHVPHLSGRPVAKIREQELVLNPRHFNSGYYVIIMTVITKKPKSYVLSDIMKKFILVQLERRKTEVIIEGGETKEIGERDNTIVLEASANGNDRDFSYDWFCSTDRKRLPRSTSDEPTRHKDSCLRSKKMWISRGRKAVVQRSSLVPSENYYIRLVVSSARIEPAVVDQRIRILPHGSHGLVLNCWSNCKAPLSTQLPLIYHLKCSNCTGFKWTIEWGRWPQPLDHCKNMRECKVPAATIKGMESNRTAMLRATGVDSEGNASSTTSLIVTGNPPRGGSCSLLPRSGKAYRTKFSVLCEGFGKRSETITYRFQLLSLGHRQPLLQHGHAPSIRDIMLPAAEGNVAVIVVEVCNSPRSCVTLRTSAYIYPPGLLVKVSATKKIRSILGEHDLQKLSLAITSLPETAKLLKSELHSIIEMMFDVSLVSMEIAKMITDVLNYISNDVNEIDHIYKDFVWTKLLSVKDYVINSRHTASSDDVIDLMRECMHTVASLMRSPYVTINKIREAMHAMEVGRSLMAFRLPGEAPLIHVTSSYVVYLRRRHSDIKTRDVKIGNETIFMPRFTTIDDVINEEVYIFNTSNVRFYSPLRTIHHVMALNITTGWQRFSPLKRDKERNLNVTFLPMLPFSFVGSYSRMVLLSSCIHDACLYVGEVAITIRNEHKRDYLGVHWLLPGLLQEVRIEATLWDNERNFTIDGNLMKKFQLGVMSCHWLTPTSLLHGNTTSYRFEVIVYDFEDNADEYHFISIVTYTAACLSWDHETQGWLNKSCQLLTGSRPSCDCQFLPTHNELMWGSTEQTTFYASELTVHHDVINDQFTLRMYVEVLLQNPIPLIAAVVVMLLHLIGTVWGRWLDKKAFKGKEIFHLADNSPYHNHNYLVTVYTGNRSTASTTANVTIRLQGTEGKSESHLLQTEYEPILHRDSAQTFCITTSSSLGNLTAVRVWHDNVGKSPEWYLQRLAVRDPVEQRCWLFMCEVWFDKKIDYVFMTRNIEALTNFFSMFLIKLENIFKNEHLFYSIYGVQTWQLYQMTRVERILTSLFHFTLLMVVGSLLFFEEDNDNNKNKQFYTFEWSQILNGMTYSFISFPPTVIVTYLFRTTKARQGKGSFYDTVEAYAIRKNTLKNKFDNIMTLLAQKKRNKNQEIENARALKRRRKSIKSEGNSTSSNFESNSEGNNYVTCSSEFNTVNHSGPANLGAFSLWRILTSRKSGHPSTFGKKTGKSEIPARDDHVAKKSKEPKKQYVYPSARSSHVFHPHLSELSTLDAEQSSNEEAAEDFTPPPISTANFTGFCKVFPWICKFVPWFVCIFGSSAFCFYTVVIGLERSSNFSKKWVATLVASVLSSIFVFECIKVLLVSLCSTMMHYTNVQVNLEDWIPPLHNPIEAPHYKSAVRESIRITKERTWNPAYRPTPHDEYTKTDLTRRNQRKLKNRAKDVAIHAINLGLLLFTSFSQSDNMSRLQHGVNLWISGTTTQISTYNDVYTWLNTSMATLFFERYDNYFLDGQLILLSTPTLRQKRIQRNLSCYHTDTVLRLNLSKRIDCKDSLKSWNEDREDYGPAWKREPEVSSPYYALDSRSPWSYTTEDVPWLVHYYGKHGVYSGEGYYVTLPFKHPDELRNLTGYLQRHNWLDGYTRVIFMDLCVFNHVVNIFAVVTVAIETTGVGVATVSSSISLAESSIIQSPFDVVRRLVLYAILIVVVYSATDIIGKLREHSYQFFYNHWNAIYFFATCLTGIEAFLYLLSASLIHKGNEAEMSNLKSFHIYHAATNLAYFIRCILALGIFFTMIYTVRILQGHPIFDTIHHTFRRAEVDLEGHTLYLVVMYIAFCHLGLILFSETLDFSNVLKTMQTVFGFAMEAFSSSNLLVDYPTTGGLYLTAFVACFVTIFVNFYVTILENSFRESKLLRRDFNKKINVLSFGRKYLRSMFTIRRQKLNEMQTSNEKVNYMNFLKKYKTEKDIFHDNISDSSDYIADSQEAFV